MLIPSLQETSRQAWAASCLGEEREPIQVLDLKTHELKTIRKKPNVGESTRISTTRPTPSAVGKVAAHLHPPSHRSGSKIYFLKSKVRKLEQDFVW